LWEKGDGDRLLSWIVLWLVALGELGGECELDMSKVRMVGESLVLSFLGGWVVGERVICGGWGLTSVLLLLFCGWMRPLIQLDGMVALGVNL
jgi:hypothetical protein